MSTATASTARPKSGCPAWPILTARVAAIPAYADHFIKHHPDIHSPGDIHISDIANALGAFINATWQRIDTPFDRHLRGDSEAMNPVQLRGMRLFYGKANCASCHSGMWLSDQSFHALGLPAFGPGRTRLHNLMARDLGRLNETDDVKDAYAFRTPMLRNVALTVDFIIQQDRLEMARQAAHVPSAGPALTDREIESLVAFMHALTDERDDAPTLVPDAVPSGLPVDRVEHTLAEHRSP